MVDSWVSLRLKTGWNHHHHNHHCSFARSVRLAETAAAEEEHGEEADKPERERDVEVVSHRPNHVISVGLDHWSRANCVVLGEEERTGDSREDKLADTGDESANDRAESESVSPGAHEHEDGVDADDAVVCWHKRANKRQLGAALLAVNVTVLNHLNVIFEQIAIEILVTPVHWPTAFDPDIVAPLINKHGGVAIVIRLFESPCVCPCALLLDYELIFVVIDWIWRSARGPPKTFWSTWSFGTIVPSIRGNSLSLAVSGSSCFPLHKLRLKHLVLFHTVLVCILWCVVEAIFVVRLIFSIYFRLTTAIQFVASPHVFTTGPYIFSDGLILLSHSSTIIRECCSFYTLTIIVPVFCFETSCFGINTSAIDFSNLLTFEAACCIKPDCSIMHSVPFFVLLARPLDPLLVQISVFSLFIFALHSLNLSEVVAVV